MDCTFIPYFYDGCDFLPMLGFKLNCVSKGGLWQIPYSNLWFFPSVMVWFRLIVSWSMPWFNIKISSYQYRKSYCRDKTVVRSSYLHNGISYTGKMASLYWTNLPESTTMTCQIEEVVVCCLSESNPINLCHPCNSLCAKFFREKINIFTFYAISPHWYDTGCWNTSSNMKTRTCPFYIVNIMAAGVLATQGAWTSAVIILTLVNRYDSVPAR